MAVDLGSGDGRGPYRRARREPDRLQIAVDLNADALAGIAWRAARKPRRGGVPNLLCVAADPEELAQELPGVADRLTVILPWGSLLRGFVLPRAETLVALHALGQAGAQVEIVFSYGARDAGAGAPLGDLVVDAAYVHDYLREQYRRAGLELTDARRIDHRELTALGTTWAKRLALGSKREVWRLSVSRADY